MVCIRDEDVRQDIRMDTKLENLCKLHAAAWASFQRRAGHEFKFSVAVWTVAVGLIAIDLKMDLPHIGVLPLLVAGAVFVLLHGWYEYGMMRSNDTDLAKCYVLEAAIRNAIHFDWPKDLQGEIDSHTNACLIKKHWSHICHLSITFFLACTAVWVLSTSQSKPPAQKDKATSSFSDSQTIGAPGSNPQKLKALQEAPPSPTKRHGGESNLPLDVTVQPNKTNAPDASGAR